MSVSPAQRLATALREIINACVDDTGMMASIPWAKIEAAKSALNEFDPASPKVVLAYDDQGQVKPDVFVDAHDAWPTGIVVSDSTGAVLKRPQMGTYVPAGTMVAVTAGELSEAVRAANDSTTGSDYWEGWEAACDALRSQWGTPASRAQWLADTIAALLERGPDE